ncbi:MAG: hypothetical protein ABIR54_00415 [Burkholderiaceae bacterium]
MPTRRPTGTSAPDFVDTRPDAALGATPATSRRAPPKQGPATGWAESAINLAEGTEIMEYPEDTAADLMDEFFAQPEKRAA